MPTSGYRLDRGALGNGRCPARSPTRFIASVSKRQNVVWSSAGRSDKLVPANKTLSENRCLLQPELEPRPVARPPHSRRSRRRDFCPLPGNLCQARATLGSDWYQAQVSSASWWALARDTATCAAKLATSLEPDGLSGTTVGIHHENRRPDRTPCKQTAATFAEIAHQGISDTGGDYRAVRNISSYGGRETRSCRGNVPTVHADRDGAIPDRVRPFNIAVLASDTALDTFAHPIDGISGLGGDNRISLGRRDVEAELCGGPCRG